MLELRSPEDQIFQHNASLGEAIAQKIKLGTMLHRLWVSVGHTIDDSSDQLDRTFALFFLFADTHSRGQKPGDFSPD